MAIREVVKIDEEKCTGCGECVPACAEGAIQIVDGVAKLIAENLCDGLGACLGDCPEGAISIEKREADDFDQTAVEDHLQQKQTSQPAPAAKKPTAAGFTGCPGSRMLQFDEPQGSQTQASSQTQPSALRQWPIQLHLVPPTAPFFRRANVLLAADCVAFAMGDFHQNHLSNHALAVACPKLDQGMEIYLKKLISMIDEAEINTLEVMIMEVPCCSGLLRLAKQAIEQAKRNVPLKQIVVGLKGEILREEWITS